VVALARTGMAGSGSRIAGTPEVHARYMARAADREHALEHTWLLPRGPVPCQNSPSPVTVQLMPEAVVLLSPVSATVRCWDHSSPWSVN